jgi:hypothetical protein
MQTLTGVKGLQTCLKLSRVVMARLTILKGVKQRSGRRGPPITFLMTVRVEDNIKPTAQKHVSGCAKNASRLGIPVRRLTLIAVSLQQRQLRAALLTSSAYIASTSATELNHPNIS